MYFCYLDIIICILVDAANSLMSVEVLVDALRRRYLLGRGRGRGRGRESEREGIGESERARAHEQASERASELEG